MSQRLERLKQLLQIKKEATYAAYHEFLKAQEQFKHNKLKHDQLVAYRQDYLKQVEKIGQQGTAVARLRNRIDFISHLDTALIQLTAHLAHLGKIRAKAELKYKQTKISEEGVGQLVDRVNKIEQLKLQRIEQKENDEYAQKQWYSKKINE
ncbi:flagellar export protein FliJ [Legionella resiliens]|uniref:Flagellar FliJ protein n=1 Tax=Legionella resiliens TaxID=2905958 RepID=A0ABS8X5Q2_9GAMM|nr:MULTISPECIES: flagellar export protein FliJ [unclassified Legionella]MCE0723523.1 flagellar export protein FliJ [Legionella sp. 9fVS26]MCE3532677.1 flagellar export protein FliJ [Legionella sp. 8cVS16]